MKATDFTVQCKCLSCSVNTLFLIMKSLILILSSVLVIGELCDAAPQGAQLTIPFENMFGNTDSQTRVYRIAFRPDDGAKNRVKFEAKHGRFGERLIASFGEGKAPGPSSFIDDHVINRNNWVVKTKKRHQSYSSTIPHETTTATTGTPNIPTTSKLDTSRRK